MMGLLDALRRLSNLSSLDKIKRAIDSLSEEEWSDLFQWMQEELSDVETGFDPDDDESPLPKGEGWKKAKGIGWY